MSNEKPMPFDAEEPILSYTKKPNTRDPELQARAKDERILRIRQALQQELEQEFRALPESYDDKLAHKQKEIKDDINKLLGFDNITDHEKYAEITTKIMQVKEEIKEHYDLQQKKETSVETELERLEKLKLIIDSEIYALKCEFEDAEEAIRDHRVYIIQINLYSKKA
jgi:hypothetical protein